VVAQVEFFCSPEEEAYVLDYVRQSADVMALPMALQMPSALSAVSLELLPAWPAPFDVFIWMRSAGQLAWHNARPIVQGETHGQLVNRLFAANAWDAASPHAGLAMLDLDASPVLIYRRALVRDGQIGPCVLFARASNIDRVSPDFAKWTRRVLSWVRRHSQLIHDWRKQHPTLPNPYSIVSSIHAFPDALADIESGKHPFAILLR